MAFKEEHNSLIIENSGKWNPLGAILFGAIAGTFIGFASEKIEAAISVFALISVAGSVLTLYENLTKFKSIVIDFEAKTIEGSNKVFGYNVKELSVSNFDLKQFCFTEHHSNRKFFQKYWFHYKSETLMLVLSSESKDELTKVFQKYGGDPKLTGTKVGKFLVNDGGSSL